MNHVADYTTRELDLQNEIKGAEELEEIKNEISKSFPMDELRFPKYWSDLSNQDVLVSEFIEGKSLEEGIEENLCHGTLCYDYLEYMGLTYLALEHSMAIYILVIVL